jgi:hypothetical protein
VNSLQSIGVSDGNPSDELQAPEVEFLKKEVLREEVKSGYPSVLGLALKRFWTAPRNGCGSKIMTARKWPRAVSPQSSIWPLRHNRSTFRFNGN